MEINNNGTRTAPIEKTAIGHTIGTVLELCG